MDHKAICDTGYQSGLAELGAGHIWGRYRQLEHVDLRLGMNGNGGKLTALKDLPTLVNPASALDAMQYERYSRHLSLGEVGLAGQLKLANARVLVIGAGGLGSPALLYLAAAGVGTIGIVDDDSVDLSNLQRQIIHATADLSRSKVSSARDSMLAINPSINVITYEERLTPDNALEIFSHFDVIMDGTDNFSTRLLVNDAAAILAKPYVWGSILQFEGQVSVFWHGFGPQYRDLYPETPPEGMIPNCAEGGVLGILCGVIGSVMTTEVLKLILGQGESLLGFLLTYDALTMEWHKSTLSYDSQRLRPVKESLRVEQSEIGSPVKEEDTLDASDVFAMLSAITDDSSRVRLIDVREEIEHSVQRIEGATLVPLSALSSQAGQEISANQDDLLIVYCKSGVRSARALGLLHEKGFHDVRHLTGGIDAWISNGYPVIR